MSILLSILHLFRYIFGFHHKHCASNQKVLTFVIFFTQKFSSTGQNASASALNWFSSDNAHSWARLKQFRSRWNNYKTNARKAARGNIESFRQQFLQNHFLQDDHHGFLEDVEVTLIDKTQASEPTKREYYQMRTLSFKALQFHVHTSLLQPIWTVFNSRFLSMALGAQWLIF